MSEVEESDMTSEKKTATRKPPQVAILGILNHCTGISVNERTRFC